MVRLLLSLVFAAVLCACSRESAPPSVAAPSSTPSATATRAAAQPSSDPGATPGAKAVPDDESDELPDLEDLLDDKPSGPDFEIDATASSYYGPVPNTVSFRAKALNGSPPFTFTWDFGDGSEKVTGERAQHTYDKVGTFNAFVRGEDANKEHSLVQLILVLVTPERFVDTMNLDPKLLDKLHSPSPTPAETPAQGGAHAP